MAYNLFNSLPKLYGWDSSCLGVLWVPFRWCSCFDAYISYFLFSYCFLWFFYCGWFHISCTKCSFLFCILVIFHLFINIKFIIKKTTKIKRNNDKHDTLKKILIIFIYKTNIILFIYVKYLILNIYLFLIK